MNRTPYSLMLWHLACNNTLAISFNRLKRHIEITHMKNMCIHNRAALQNHQSFKLVKKTVKHIQILKYRLLGSFKGNCNRNTCMPQNQLPNLHLILLLFILQFQCSPNVIMFGFDLVLVSRLKRDHQDDTYCCVPIPRPCFQIFQIHLYRVLSISFVVNMTVNLSQIHLHNASCIEPGF